MSPTASWPPTLAPGKGCKFAIVDTVSGRCSSTWRVSTAKNVDQIFLMELGTGPVWKVSLHNEPGHVTGEPSWRIAMTRDGAESLGVERSVIDEWIPEPTRSGWVEGVGVLIPFAHLRRPREPLPSSVVQVPASEACSGYSVRLFLEDTESVGAAFPAGLPIAVFDRCAGGRLYVLAAPVDLGSRQFGAFDLMRERARLERSESMTYPTDRFVGVLRLQDQRVLVDLTVD